MLATVWEELAAIIGVQTKCVANRTQASSYVILSPRSCNRQTRGRTVSAFSLFQSTYAAVIQSEQDNTYGVMAAHRTAWSGKSSTLPSDRIAPRPQRSSTPSGTKSKQKEPDVPKSTEVRRLEGFKDGLLRTINHGVLKDPKGGCFCQGVSCCVVM